VVPVPVGDPGPQLDAFSATLGPGARIDRSELYKGWNVPGTPFGVAVGMQRTIIAMGVTNTVAQVEALADEALRSQSELIAIEPRSELEHARERG
jgi:hypothetical protein